MAAVTGELPEKDEEWGFEVKWDGVRTIVYVADERVRVTSRSERDVTVA